MTELSKYEEQFERMKRWYKRVFAITFGMTHNKNTNNYQDEVYAFFINCYHLKDWIINDKTVKIENKKQKIENFINANECMRLCADICNGLKHLKLDKNIRTGIQPEFKERKFELELGGKEAKIIVKYNIATSKGNKDAFLLATDCKEKWEEFIETEIK